MNLSIISNYEEPEVIVERVYTLYTRMERSIEVLLIANSLGIVASPTVACYASIALPIIELLSRREGRENVIATARIIAQHATGRAVQLIRIIDNSIKPLNDLAALLAKT